MGEVAKDLDLTETALRDWVKRAEEAPQPASPETLSTAERDELRELRKRVKRLEMEREILKNSPRASSYLLDQKLTRRYITSGSEGATGCFLATTAIP